MQVNGYLHHRGKPLVTLWGVGFNDKRAYGLEQCAQAVDFLKAEGNAIMLGVPYYWRELNRDAVNDPALLELLKKADIISPWSIGRYRRLDSVAKNLPGTVRGSSVDEGKPTLLHPGDLPRLQLAES